MRRVMLLSFIGILLISGCKDHVTRKNEIIIFHAGSLSVPFKELSAEYRKKRPGIKILLEPAGSLVCARKVTELKKPCDIIASADYFVINQLLIPDFATWSIRFATNEIVIAFQEKSQYASKINKANWMDILLQKDVIYSRSDPDSDPCGYRTVMTLLLAEKYYNRPGFAEKMIAKNKDFMRPKEVDLVALVESNAADYMFQYKSVAIQHNLKYIELPDEINLSDPEKNIIYRTVSLNVAGSSPGSKMKVTGEFINYSVTMLSDAPNKDDALDFLAFMISPDGMEIFRKNGQPPIIPFSSEQQELIPGRLLKYLN
jgi:molybdate/tungstate transport system substrate-binding protein